MTDLPGSQAPQFNFVMEPPEHNMYSLDEMDVLLKAAREGDVSKIERLLRPDVYIDTGGRIDGIPDVHEGATMLERAAEHNQLETMKFLIRKGANVNLQRDEVNVLLSAAYSGDPDVVKLLIESGADINRRGFEESSALHQAVDGLHGISAEKLERKAVTVRILVDYGLDIDALDEYGRTALHWAALRQCLQLVEVLVSKGANINAREDRGTPLESAAEGGSLEIVKFLLQKGAMVNIDGIGCLALGPAASAGNTAMVLLLLDHGAKAGICPQRMCPELLCAACSGNAETVSLLYERGFDRQGPLSLFRATILKSLSVIKLLLAQGIDVHTRGQDGVSLLHAAVLRNRFLRWNEDVQLDALHLLLDKGVDVNIRDKNGQTAQDLAIASNYMNVVKAFETRSLSLQLTLH